MARRPNSIPSYCLHKASGKAVVRLDGVDHYLGPHGSPESINEPRHRQRFVMAGILIEFSSPPAVQEICNLSFG
jgi:hypothetical protein